MKGRDGQGPQVALSLSDHLIIERHRKTHVSLLKSSPKSYTGLYLVKDLDL